MSDVYGSIQRLEEWISDERGPKNPRLIRDIRCVIAAAKEETQDDDDVRLTIEDAEKEFGSRGHIDATVSSHRAVVAVKIDDWILLETRGDLRTLLSILPPF